MPKFQYRFLSPQLLKKIVKLEIKFRHLYYLEKIGDTFFVISKLGRIFCCSDTFCISWDMWGKIFSIWRQRMTCSCHLEIEGTFFLESRKKYGDIYSYASQIKTWRNHSFFLETNFKRVFTNTTRWINPKKESSSKLSESCESSKSSHFFATSLEFGAHQWKVALCIRWSNFSFLLNSMIQKKMCSRLPACLWRQKWHFLCGTPSLDSFIWCKLVIVPHMKMHPAFSQSSLSNIVEHWRTPPCICSPGALQQLFTKEANCLLLACALWIVQRWTDVKFNFQISERDQ